MATQLPSPAGKRAIKVLPLTGWNLGLTETRTNQQGYEPKQVTITTDGACIPNPGNGGWAAVLRYGNSVREICGAEPETTNNRMELRAILESLRCLKEPCRVILRTDSSQSIGLLNHTGIKVHKRSNQDLVQAIISAMQPHEIQAVWIKGHIGDPDNERADFLANECANALTPSRCEPRTGSPDLAAPGYPPARACAT